MTYKLDHKTARNYSSRASYGFAAKPTGITIHHWGSTGQHHATVANYLASANARKVSAHEVISGGWVTHLLSFRRAAWHAGNRTGNGATIGLECRPEMSASDYRTLVQRCADIEEKEGSLYYYGHRDWVATACPGKYYKRIGKLVKDVNKEHKRRKNGGGTGGGNMGLKHVSGTYYGPAQSAGKPGHKRLLTINAGKTKRGGRLVSAWWKRGKFLIVVRGRILGMTEKDDHCDIQPYVVKFNRNGPNGDPKVTLRNRVDRQGGKPNGYFHFAHTITARKGERIRLYAVPYGDGLEVSNLKCDVFKY